MDVPDPGVAMELGLKLTLKPPPRPEADNAIAELKLPEIAVVIVVLPDELLATVKLEGAAETVKPLGTAAVTVSETVVVWVNLPPVPVTVIG